MTDTIEVGARFAATPDDNAAIVASAQTLLESCRLATLTIMPAEALEQMGDVGVAGSAVQAAITAILRSHFARTISTYDGLAFVVGLGFGEILRTVQQVDIGATLEFMGQGIAHAMLSGDQKPTGSMQ